MIFDLLFMLPLYAICAGVIGGFTHHGLRFYKNDDRMAGTVFSALFWPVAMLVWICVLSVQQTNKRVDQVSSRNAETKYRGLVARTKTQMMEDDLERFSGNQELAIQFDYETCPRCHGAGGGGGKTCPKCKGKRVIRIRNGAVEE